MNLKIEIWNLSASQSTVEWNRNANGGKKSTISHILSQNKHKTVIWSEYKISCRNIFWTQREHTKWSFLSLFLPCLLRFHMVNLNDLNEKKYIKTLFECQSIFYFFLSLSFLTISSGTCMSTLCIKRERNMNKLKSNIVFALKACCRKINFFPNLIFNVSAMCVCRRVFHHSTCLSCSKLI